MKLKHNLAFEPEFLKAHKSTSYKKMFFEKYKPKKKADFLKKTDSYLKFLLFIKFGVMSKPRNHHYVSRCLISNFFNKEGKIFLFDKSKAIVSFNLSPKRIFSERDLNAFINDAGEIEYAKIENELNKHFEQAFPFHYNRIKTVALETSYNKLEESAESGELAESIYYVMGMAVIGDSRTPTRKAELDKIVSDLFQTLSENATSKLKKRLSYQFSPILGTSNIPYKTPPVDFNKIKTTILKDMGDVIVSILVAPEGDFFLLPDCTSLNERRQLVPDTILNGQRLKVLFKNIAVVGMPLDSQIFVVLKAKKISKEQEHSIRYPTSEQVYNINCSIFQKANRYVACENKSYLEAFVEKQIIRE